jgi:cytochrome P450
MSARARPVLGSEPFRPRSAAYLQDPYAQLRELRSRGSCYVDPGSGLWFLLGYDDVDAGLSQITREGADDADRQVHFPDNPFAADGPGHLGPRRLIAPKLANRAVQQLRARAQGIVDAALRGKDRGGELRVVEEIGFPLPYLLTCDILGVPDVDNRDELRDWTWKSLELNDAFLTDEQLRVDLEAARCLAEHLSGVLAWKRDHPADDLLSLILQAADVGEVLRPEQVPAFVYTLYLAGMHTTVNQIALGLHALLRHREQWERLHREPSLLENAVEELLRFEPTAQYMRRNGGRDVEIGGVAIPAGTEVVCWIASANRDERRFGPTADELDITRKDAPQHLAFGKGPHVCAGSWLARLELQLVVGTLIRRFPNTELVDQELVWSSNFIRGPQELVLRLRP